jgi:hypothetical protein
LRARFLFGEGINYYHLDLLFNQGWVLKSTKISDEFTFEDMSKFYNDKIIPFFSINENGELIVSTLDNLIAPSSGDTVIALVMVEEQED